MSGPRSILATLAVATLLSGCGTAQSSVPGKEGTSDTPVETVNTWFRAINSGDEQGARQLFANNPDQLAWISDAPRPAFTDIHCRDVEHPAGSQADSRSAGVYCTFKEAPGDWMGNPDSWYTVSLAKGTDGRWRITNYGQG
jgi:hypothetical protein